MLPQGSHHPEMFSKTLMFRISSNKAALRKQSSEGGQIGVPWCLDILIAWSAVIKAIKFLYVTYDDTGNQTSYI